MCLSKLIYTQKLQKWLYNKEIKLQSYVSGKKIWFKSIYIKTKQNHKLKSKFFGLFRVLDSIGKQTYKLDLLAK